MAYPTLFLKSGIAHTAAVILALSLGLNPDHTPDSLVQNIYYHVTKPAL